MVSVGGKRGGGGRGLVSMFTRTNSRGWVDDKQRWQAGWGGMRGVVSFKKTRQNIMFVTPCKDDRADFAGNYHEF